ASVNTDPAERGSGNRRANASAATHAARPAPERLIAQGATTIPSTDPAAMHKRAKPSVPGGTPRAALTRGMWATHEATTNPFNANHPVMTRWRSGEIDR